MYGRHSYIVPGTRDIRVRWRWASRGGQGPQRGVWVHRPPLDPPRGSTQTPPCSHMGGQGVWCASRGGSRPPEGGLSSPTPPRPPSWIHPRTQTPTLLYILPSNRQGGSGREPEGGQGPQRPPEACPADADGPMADLSDAPAMPLPLRAGKCGSLPDRSRARAAEPGLSSGREPTRDAHSSGQLPRRAVMSVSGMCEANGKARTSMSAKLIFRVS